MKILKKLSGHSNSEILLMKDFDKIFVRKTFDIDRNIERYRKLKELSIPVPAILKVQNESYDMEYIRHLDMKTFLSTSDPREVSAFVNKVLNIFKSTSVDFDYSNVFSNKLSKFDFERYNLPFDKNDLLEKLPKILPRSPYHGDFTLENILYDLDKKEFVLIDPLTTEYDSFVFDIAKLKQDLECKWFIRNENYFLDSKLKIILDSLDQFKYHDNRYLLIMMLLRVLPYTKHQSDEFFLTNEIKKLWK